MHWIYLLVAGICEIGFTTALKLSDNFTKAAPTIGFLLLGAISFYLLSLSMKNIPLGTAYAVWTGIGAFGTAVVGILFFGDPVFFWRVFFLLLLVASIVGLKLVSNA